MNEENARDYTSLLTLPDERKQKALEMFVTFLQAADGTPEDGYFHLADSALWLADDVALEFGIVKPIVK